MALSGFSPCATCHGLGFDGLTLEMCRRCGGHGHIRPSETSPAADAGASGASGVRTTRIPAVRPATSPAPLTCPKCGGWMYAERDGHLEDGSRELACVRCGKRLYLPASAVGGATREPTR